MQLKENTRYRLANDEIVGPLKKHELWKPVDRGELVGGKFSGLWNDDGTHDFFGTQHTNSKYAHKYDIVEEVED